MNIEAEFNRIDEIRSVSSMQDGLERLPKASQVQVILHALRKSRFQWTWSYFAKKYGVPESDWPERDV